MSPATQPFLRSTLLTLMLLLAASAPALAKWPNDPLHNLVVTEDSYYGEPIAVASDGAGGAIVAWISGNYWVMAQRINASGQLLWPPVTVCSLAGSRGSVHVGADGQGGAVIVWQDSRTGSMQIYAQRIGPTGTVLWTSGGLLVAGAAGVQTGAKVACDGTNAFVTWVDLRNGNQDIYVQGLALATGARLMGTSGFGACVATNEQSMPVIAVGTDGDPVIAWRDARSGNFDIYAGKVYDTSGTFWTTAVCSATGIQSAPRLALDSFNHVIVAWTDLRSGNNDIYAQRLYGWSGDIVWAANGVALCASAGEQVEPALCTDGVNGAVVTWTDRRSGAADVYAQRTSALGTAQWTANGVLLCSTEGDQTDPVVVPDGANGGIVAWQDARYGTETVFAQRVSATGVPTWTTDGVAVSTFGEMHLAPFAVTAPNGGALVVGNTGYWTLWAQRVDQFGKLGAEPEIVSVRDVPGDQGGFVKLSWLASPLDSLPAYAIDDYLVFRSVPPDLVARALREGAMLSAAGSPDLRAARRVIVTRGEGAALTYWEYVASVQARHEPGYSCVVATAGDSTAAGAPTTKFMVQAHTYMGPQWWDSAPDSGYSVDDLAPAVPAPFTGTYASGTTALNWGPSAAPDLAEYRLYRGPHSRFVPDASNLVTTTTETAFADAAGEPCYYRLCAVDLHGNVSPYAFLQPAGTVDVTGPALPRELALSAPAPNPLRGSTTLRLALPRAAAVSLAIYDQQGRRVRTLLAGTQPAGERPVAWDGRDDGGRGVASGMYFVRCETEGRTFTRRIVAIR